MTFGGKEYSNGDTVDTTVARGGNQVRLTRKTLTATDASGNTLQVSGVIPMRPPTVLSAADPRAIFLQSVSPSAGGSPPAGHWPRSSWWWTGSLFSAAPSQWSGFTPSHHHAALTSFAIVPGGVAAPRGAAQASARRALQWLWPVLPGRALPSGRAGVAPAHRGMRRIALER